MEPNQPKEEIEEEEDEDEGSSRSYWGYIILFAVGVFLGYQFHPNIPPEKVIDGQYGSLQYNKGYDDGKKDGQRFERTQWCEPQEKLKPGDMDLKCLKLFLDGAGSSLMEKNGIRIENL